MNVNLEGLASELQRIADEDSTGAYESGVLTLAGEAVRELGRREKTEDMARNAAAMREALENACRQLEPITDEICECGRCVRNRDIIKLARDALAAPARNCDVYPAKEWKRRFKQFCRTRPDRCHECPVFGMWDFSNGEEASCLAIWATMPHAGAGWPTQGARNGGGLEAGASGTGQEGSR